VGYETNKITNQIIPEGVKTMIQKNTITAEQSPLIKYGWLRSVLFLIASFISSAVIFSLIGLIVVSLVFNIDPSQIMTDARNIIKDLGLPANIIINLFTFMGMLVTAWIFRRFIDRKSFKSMGFAFSDFKRDFVLGLILGFLLIAVGFGLLSILGLMKISDIRFDFLLILGYIVFLTITSFNEEIMLRGYVLNNFCDSMNRYIALIISSVIFGIMHLANANMSFLPFLNICLAGILLGIYYIHKRNLWLPITLHFSWNFFQGPVFGFEVSGVEASGIIIQDLSGSDLWTGGEFGFEGSLIATILVVSAIVLLHMKYRNK
jgi:membrane protease YdiL (CAAX protease family)